MKLTQLKDGLRNIWKQRVSFLSIIIIAALGVTAFLGIDVTATAMRKNGSEMYNELNFRDVEIVSTLLFSEEDLSDIKNVKGVADAEPVLLTSAKVTVNDEKKNVQVTTVTERINRAKAEEGRLPENATECALETRLAKELGLKVGDTLEVTGSDGGAATFLTGTEFKITGLVLHPDHVNNIVPDSLYVLVIKDAFDLKKGLLDEIERRSGELGFEGGSFDTDLLRSDGTDLIGEELDNCFMKAEIVIEKDANVDRFSKDYEDRVAKVMERIDELAFSATRRRDGRVKELAKEWLEAIFDKIENGKAAIRKVIRTATENSVENAADDPLFSWAEKRKANVDDPGETASLFYITDSVAIDLSKPLTEFFRSAVGSEIISDKMLEGLYSATHPGRALPQKDGETDYEAIRSELAETADGLGEKYEEITNGVLFWDRLHDIYYETFYTNEKTVSALEPCRWLSFDGKGNSSFAQMTVSSGNFSNLKSTFGLMFVLVGALVIFATVSKMVDEQRTQVGTTKALGFFNYEIFFKYLSFGVLATLLGTALGTLLSRFLIEPLILNSFVLYYEFDLTKPHITALPIILVTLAAVLLAVVAIWISCARLLGEPAIRLMAPKTPPVKKRKAKSGKRVLPLYSRLIVRNMLSDWKRVLVTIVSVAGCCALIVIGLTLRTAANGSIKRQYEEIVDYDVCVKFDPSSSETVQSDLEAIVAESGAESAAVYVVNATYRIDQLQVTEIICGDVEKINGFYRVNDWKTGKPLASTDKGAFVQRRIAEIYGFDVGSEFEIAINGTRTAKIRVAGVFENFIGRSIVMSKNYYESIFGVEAAPNALYVRLDGASLAALSEDFKSVAGYERYSMADEGRTVIETSMLTINVLVAIFIFVAAMMAGVVQLNLTNMYVSQKMREMTIMRVNGFTAKEVIGFVLRETVITTILGILLGLAAGAGIAYNIERTMEQSFVQFDRRVDLIAWLIAAALTIVFTVIVNAVALKKVKKLKLTDVD